MAQQTEIAAWLLARRTGSGDEAASASDDILLQFLNEDITLEDAVSRVHSIPKTRSKGFTVNDYISKIENDVLSLALEFPDLQERLILLLLELEKDSTDSGKSLLVNIHDGQNES
jgi:hypothetical protein